MKARINNSKQAFACLQVVIASMLAQIENNEESLTEIISFLSSMVAGELYDNPDEMMDLIDQAKKNMIVSLSMSEWIDLDDENIKDDYSFNSNRVGHA
tara:strand:- start:103 stop:396 length:294 start_codon:yes stop_codon:yes gene_type:complete